MRTRLLRCFAGLLLSCAATGTFPHPVWAWKPYTHNTTAQRALEDARDGLVEINGREYALRPELALALRNWPEFYNAGVIGPDGFPDITYGQAVIHPQMTGEWLQHILESAWEAQADSGRSADEKQQILAFSYGFLTHAAGDLWGHTLVNDFALGVFPGVQEILESEEQAGIALRHIIIEGYLGDSTPGFDGNSEQATLPDGDVSDDSTAGIRFNAPHDFIFETLVDPAAATPLADRGPILDLFLELRDSLEDVMVPAPSLSNALTAFEDTEASLMGVQTACFDDFDLIDCLGALIEFGFDAVIDSVEFLALTVVEIGKAAGQVFNAYLNAWVDDIDVGMMDWSELGLGITKGLFDPQARRDLQNEECDFASEGTMLRAMCESGIGAVDVVLEQVNPFITNHLLSMAGAPDVLGELVEVLQDLFSRLDDILDELLPNFVREGLAAANQFAKDLLFDAIKGVLGIDIERLLEILREPSRLICQDEVVFPLPPPIGDVMIPLFAAGEHERLDGILAHAPDAHHEDDPEPGCGRLFDVAEVDLAAVAPLDNTTVLAKLLLLDGPELNRLLSLELNRTIATYPPTPIANVMVDALAIGIPDTWLRSIDGDHGWRADGLPRYCNEEEPLCTGTPAPDCLASEAPCPRPQLLNAGNGTFPVWESCTLRPAFRTLFADWENGSESFPDFGDSASQDDLNDPEAPTSTLVQSAGASFGGGSTLFVAFDNEFELSTLDGPPGKAFSDDVLGLERRIRTTASNPSFVPAAQNDRFSVSGPDGVYFIDYHSDDPCHTFASADGLDPAEPVRTAHVTLDTTPPAVTCETPPFGLQFDSNDVPDVDFSVDDAPLGAGVADVTATIDGFRLLPLIVPTADGAPIDMFLFDPGTRTVEVSTEDNLGNAGVETCLFELHATASSLLSNVIRARTEGLITKANSSDGDYQALRQKLDEAILAHDKGRHDLEHAKLSAFINKLAAQRGKAIDAATADALIAFAADLIASGG